MELRDLKAEDLWQLARVLRKLGIKELTASIDKEDVRALVNYKKPMMRKNGKNVPVPPEKYTESQIEAADRADMAWESVSPIVPQSNAPKNPAIVSMTLLPSVPQSMP